MVPAMDSEGGQWLLSPLQAVRLFCIPALHSGGTIRGPTISARLILHGCYMPSGSQRIRVLKAQVPTHSGGTQLFLSFHSMTFPVTFDCKIKTDVPQIRNAFRQMASLGLFLKFTATSTNYLPKTTQQHGRENMWRKVALPPCF